jgi:hypothetical protein
MLHPSQRLKQPHHLKETDFYSWKKQAHTAEDNPDLSPVESDFVLTLKQVKDADWFFAET